MVDTIKFSEMTPGGDIANDDKVPGLLGGGNVLFNNPWTFLAPGSTAERPIPSSAIEYRLRFNTTLEVYEYYDPSTLTWTQLSGTGTGTVNPGVANDLAYYAVNGQIISPVNGANSAVLVTGGTGIPSLSTTLPTGLSIPGASITESTAALLSGSVIAAPVAGIDLVNKTYVDALIAAGVLSITGTANQVIASSPTGNVTLSLPQDIATGSTPTFLGLTLSAIPLTVSSGGTGVSTVTIAPTASAFAGWDANSNLSASNFLSGTTLVTNSGGTTTLTVASTGQFIFSGATFETVQMPVVATLATGQAYRLVNDSSNALFVISSGSNGIVTMQPETSAVLTFNGVAATDETSWSVDYTSNTIGVQSLTGTANQIDVSSPTGNVTLSLPATLVAPGTFAVGNFLLSSTTISSSSSMNFSGTAPDYVFEGTAAAGAEIRIRENTTNGLDYFALKAPSSITTSYVLNYPSTPAPVNSSTLISSTAGVLSWANWEENISWTPVPFGNSTAGSPTGTFSGVYSRHGRLVRVSFQLIFTSLGGMVGQLRLAGLPYVILNSVANRAGIEIAVRTNFTNMFAISGYGLNNSSTIHFFNAELDNTSLLITDLSNTTEIYGSLLYLTT